MFSEGCRMSQSYSWRQNCKLGSREILKSVRRVGWEEGGEKRPQCVGGLNLGGVRT